MPIVYKKEREGAWLVLWRITESAAELAANATPTEIERARRIRNEGRRCQWLAWRAALRTMIPDVEIWYDENGAPQLKRPGKDAVADPTKLGHIGVAHTKEYAAVIWSRTERCAVDMEQAGRDFRRAEPRYLSERELRLPGHDQPWFAPLIWCGKEALYKYAGTPGLDLRDNIRIETIKFSLENKAGSPAGQLTGRIRGGDPVALSFFMYDGHMVVFTPPAE